MSIYTILKQKLDDQFPGYVIQLKDVPDEEGVISINVFGVAREDFNGVKEFIFDVEDDLVVDELFIPICYTKQELIEHYPAMASEYFLKQALVLKKKEAAVLSSVFESYDFLNCSCSQASRVHFQNLDQFFSVPSTWSVEKTLAVETPSVSATDESYALAA